MSGTRLLPNIDPPAQQVVPQKTTNFILRHHWKFFADNSSCYIDCNFLNRLLRPNGIWQKRPPFLIITFTILAFFRGLDLVLVKRDMWHVDKSVRLRCHTHNILTIRWKSPISGTIKTTKTRALKTYTISHPHSWVLDFCHLNYGPVR